MSEQVNLFSVAALKNFPMKDRLVQALQLAHQLFETCWPSLDMLERHLNDTGGGMSGDHVPVTDDEMAFHHLFLQQFAALLSEITKKAGQVETKSDQRIWVTATNRGSTGFVSFGKTFEVEGELIPKPPPERAPEYAEFLEWIRASEWAGLIRIDVPWQSLKKLCETLAEQGQPMPPHVKLASKMGVKVGR